VKQQVIAMKVDPATWKHCHIHQANQKAKEQSKSVQSHLHSNELNLYVAAIFASYDHIAVVRRSRMNLIRPSVARTKDASIILETPPSIILFA
jgi:hypothetical protein